MNIKEARDIVENIFEIDISDRSRKRKYIGARTIYYYICKFYGKDLSYADFTGYIGFDHSTVIHALNAMQNDLETGVWEFKHEFKLCKIAALQKSELKDTWEGDEFRKIQDLNRKFKAEIFELLANYERAINVYEFKLQQATMDKFTVNE